MYRINPRLVFLVDAIKESKNRSTVMIKPKIVGHVIDGKPVLNSTGLIY